VGTVEITIGTSGTGVDQGDFTVQVDGAPAQVIGPNATVWAQKIEGEHTVQLHAAGQNCVVQGENPRAVTVPAGDTVKVSFMVSCSGNTGSIRIITAATGAFQDPDGYKVTLDEGREAAIPANGHSLIEGLPAGQHVVRLTEMASNCLADGSGGAELTNRPGIDDAAPSWAGVATTAVAVGRSTGALHSRLKQALRQDRRP